MTIEWFPGHMATARREAGETMRKTDLVIEVLDARLPHSSCNPMLETLRKENQRPALKLLNKVDAADPERTEQWLAFYNALPGTTAIALSAKKAGDVARIPKIAQQMLPEKGTRLKPLRMMILGVPNVGKSTLMNQLLHRHVANVGNEPAITKDQMKHQLNPGMWIVDTPGMLWPGLDQDVAVKLAAAHAVGPNAYDEAFVGVDLAGYLLANYPALVGKRFGALPAPIVEGLDGHGLLGHIADARGIAPGLDRLNKSAQVLLNEFRTGALGRISLESTAQVAERQAAAAARAAAEAEAAAQKRAREKAEKEERSRRR